jgi:selenium metabolism protein YedF
MVKTIDARGLPCPQPVILTRNAMREQAAVDVLLTGADQVANVRRLAERAGWRAVADKSGEGFVLHLTKGQATSEEPEITPEMMVCATPEAQRRVLVIAGDQMGRGEPELGAILIRTFFHTLTEMTSLPRAIVFYNTGVKLTIEDSPILEDLKTLEAKGVEILICGTCLAYYELKERIAVGAISNMYTIAETILSADQIFSP